MAYTVVSNKSFNEVSRLLESTSKDKGFRVLTIHNVRETLAEKGFEVAPLKIYELCNAGFAYQAIKNDINVAMFMPCKIVVRPEGDKTLMTLVRPSMIAEMMPDTGLDNMAVEVERQLIGLIDGIK